MAKDVVGLLQGEVVSTKKKNTLSQRMWLAYQEEMVRMIESLTKMKAY